MTEEQYREFYKTVSHDYDDPLAWTHNRVEGRSEYTQLLYVPKHAPMDLWDRDGRRGVKLYVKRVFIMDDADQLLPSYLRFVRGVIAVSYTHLGCADASPRSRYACERRGFQHAGSGL